MVAGFKVNCQYKRKERNAQGETLLSAACVKQHGEESGTLESKQQGWCHSSAVNHWRAFLGKIQNGSSF